MSVGDAGSRSRTDLHLAARDIPVPSSVSPLARRVLEAGPRVQPPYPSLDDRDGWVRHNAAIDARLLEAMAPFVDPDTSVEEIDAGGVRVYVVRPPGLDPADRRVQLELHAGCFVCGGGEACRVVGAFIAQRVGLEVWAVDYRMPPDHPYPAGLDDCVAAYRHLLEQRPPEQVVVAGGSAGSGMAASTILRARDEGLPLPAAAVLLSPEIDLTESGDSFQTNVGLDFTLTQPLMPANLLYADGHDLGDPYISPLFGDFEPGFPPTFITSGTRDLFLSNAVRMHRRLRAVGVRADLHVTEAAGHGSFIGAPEDQAIQADLARFVDEVCPR